MAFSVKPTTVAPGGTVTASGTGAKKKAARIRVGSQDPVMPNAILAEFTMPASGRFSRLITAPGGPDRQTTLVLQQVRADGVWAQTADVKLLLVTGSGGGTPPGPPNPPPPPTPDTTAPVISGVTQTVTGQTSATISWNLSEGGTGQVEYGTTSSYGSTTTLEPSYLTSHTQNITGLAAGTVYHYRIRSADAAGNLAVSGDRSFTTTAVSPPPPPPPQTADWQEEFTGNLSQWTAFDHVYTSAFRVAAGQCTVSGGILSVTEQLESAGKYVSGMLISNLTFDHGYFEARMKWPKGTGFDCAFWLRNPDSVASPRSEIDIIEAYPNEPYAYPGPGRFQFTMHYLASGVLQFHQITYPAGSGTGVISPDLTDVWHTIGLNWLPGSRMEVWIDGTSIGAITADVLAATPMHIVLSLGVGLSDWSAPADGTTPSLASMQVDYVRWWNVKPTPDVTAPVISNFVVTPTGTTAASVTCNTDKAATVIFRYGLTTSYGFQTSATPSGTSHAGSITGLAAGQTYHVIAVATDGSGNVGLSSDRTFTTQNTSPPVCTNVVQAMFDLQTALNAIADGSTLCLTAGATYTLPASWRFTNRNHLIIDGKGAMIKTNLALGSTFAGSDELIYVDGGSDITWRNFTLIGTHPNPGQYPPGPTEFQAGFGLVGLQGGLIEAITLRNNMGDGAGCYTKSGVPTRNIEIRNNDFSGQGRWSVTATHAEHIWAHHNNFANAKIIFETEADAASPSHYVSDFVAELNTVSGYNHMLFGGYGPGDLIDVVIQDNTVLAGANEGIHSYCQPTGGKRSSGLIFRRNVGKQPLNADPGWKAVVLLCHADSPSITGNTQPISGSGFVGVLYNDSTGVSVSGNTFTGQTAATGTVGSCP